MSNATGTITENGNTNRRVSNAWESEQRNSILSSNGINYDKTLGPLDGNVSPIYERATGSFNLNNIAGRAPTLDYSPAENTNKQHNKKLQEAQGALANTQVSGYRKLTVKDPSKHGDGAPVETDVKVRGNSPFNVRTTRVSRAPIGALKTHPSKDLIAPHIGSVGIAKIQKSISKSQTLKTATTITRDRTQPVGQGSAIAPTNFLVNKTLPHGQNLTLGKQNRIALKKPLQTSQSDNTSEGGSGTPKSGLHVKPRPGFRSR